MKNDAGEMSLSKNSKQKALLEHYQRLLNDEFDWDTDYLSDEPPVESLPSPITSDMVLRKLSLDENEKALGPSGIVVEMIQAAGDLGTSMICDHAAAIICDGKILTL